MGSTTVAAKPVGKASSPPRFQTSSVNLLCDKSISVVRLLRNWWSRFNGSLSRVSSCSFYGTAGRVVKTAVRQARAEGIPVGLFRPISMFPFPYARLEEISELVRQILVVELSAGQMIEDVQLATHGRVPISFFGKLGGVVPLPEDVLDEIRKLV